MKYVGPDHYIQTPYLICQKAVKTLKLMLFAMDHHHHYSNRNSQNGIIDNAPIYLLALLLLLRRRRRLQATQQPSNRQWSGQEVVDNLLNCGNVRRIQSQLRMKLDTFYQLRDWLLLHTELRSSVFGSRVVSIEEKLVIFIFIASTNASNRAAQERFNRSGSLISE
jgi:hypothetical protein